MTVEQIKAEREAREAAAKLVGEALPLGHYYAADNEVRHEGGYEVAYVAASHWDACLVMMAAHGRSTEDWADAYGRTGEQSDCDCCGGSGVEYDETCVTCGGFGWVRF